MLLIHRLLRGCDRRRPGTAVQVERPQRGEDDLDSGENADGQRICPLAVAKLVQWPSQKVTGLPRATAPSFRANLRLGARRPLSSTLTALRALLPGLQRGLSPLPSRGPGIDY